MGMGIAVVMASDGVSWDSYCKSCHVALPQPRQMGAEGRTGEKGGLAGAFLLESHAEQA